jgi:hypothetical protein
MFCRHEIFDIQQTLREHHILLQTIDRHTEDIRQAHAPETSGTVLGTDEDNGSVFSKFFEADNPESIATSRLFETVILNS